MFYVLSALLFFFPALVILGGVYDLTTMKIPNWISIALAVAFVPVALMVQLPWQDIALSLGIGLAALVIGIALFAFRILGGGDAKLLSASLMWVGMSGALGFVLVTAIAGGALSLYLLAARKWWPMMPWTAPKWFTRLMEPKGDIPYGIAIAVGAVLAFPNSELLLKLS
ncbi:pilus assembly protein CpaA [Brevundimonas sp. GN22]